MQITDIVVVVAQHQNLSNGVPDAVLLTAAGFKFQKFHWWKLLVN
jgi:hypothetical protein